MSHRRLKKQICENCGSKNIDGIYNRPYPTVHRCYDCGFEESKGESSWKKE